MTSSMKLWLQWKFMSEMLSMSGDCGTMAMYRISNCGI